MRNAQLLKGMLSFSTKSPTSMRESGLESFVEKDMRLLDFVDGNPSFPVR